MKLTDKKDRTALRYLSRTAGRAKMGIAALTGVQITQGMASVCYALFLRAVINSAVSGDKAAFWLAIARLAALFALQLVLSALHRRLDVSTRGSLENRFKERLFSALLRRDYATVTAVHSGEWMNRLTGDTGVVAGGMVEILPGLLGMAVKLIGAVSMIIVLEPRFLYLILPGGALLIVFSSLFRQKMKQLHKRIQEKDGALRSFLQDSLGSLTVVRSYAMEAQTLSTARAKMSDHLKAKLLRNRFSNIANVGFGVVMEGATVLGTVFCGYGILTGSMDYGSFTAILSLIGQIQAPFATISSFLPRYYAMIASAERLTEVELATQEPSAEPLPLSTVLSRYATDFDGFGLDKVMFHYLTRGQALSSDMEKDVLSPLPGKVSLYVHRGEYVAFTGESGCGKSTLLKLLMCVYQPDEGERYVVRHGERTRMNEEWQRLFAYVPQENHLMSGTIREIVAYADPEAMHDEQRLLNALTIACAEFVFELDKGPDTVLGERGTGLSEGQMQRIAIARAIFSRHPVLMLDECTSALDEPTERQLLANLRSMTDRTVLIVTHRPAALEICDTEIRLGERMEINGNYNCR